MLNSGAQTETEATAVVRAGLDGVALKPTECEVRRASDLPVEILTVDYEGREHVPDGDVLTALARGRDLRVTVPVRADGFDPFGDDALARGLPEEAGRVLVAGHPAYLSKDERKRAVGGRIAAAAGEDDDAWIGTEGVERVALATGGTQFELLSRTTDREFRSLRDAGFDADLTVYAPTVLTDDDDEILDAVGEYVSRRRPVSKALPDGAAVDAGAEGRAREVLLAAADDYALTGTPDDVREQVAALADAGADAVVGYPARGLDEFLRPASAAD